MALSPDQVKPRLCAARHLRAAGISSVVWFEDVGQHYGVPTHVFDLYLLVRDIDAAAKVLQQKGWWVTTQTIGRIGNALVDSPQVRLGTPNRTSSTRDWLDPLVVLLPAALWSFDLSSHDEETSGHDEIDALFLALPRLVDAYITGILDDQDGELRRPLCLHLCYLYEYSPALRDRAFADLLQHDNRQFHHDVLSGMKICTLPMIAHEREVRDKVREGLHSITDCSTSEEEKPWLFPPARQTALDGEGSAQSLERVATS